ncbi:MAG: type II toxin-antitoxin system RelE/ParE family toxin [Caulobacteraceae bacterium]
MSAKPIVPRDEARRDVEDAADYYAREAGERIALGFVDALERAYRAIASHPATGSPRYAHELNLPGLRSQAVRRFPYLIFYVERGNHIDIWRVLHAARDIPAWLREPGDG